MELKKINDIAENWRSITQTVIELRKPNLTELRILFKETYELLEEYSRNGMVPKGICEVLLEMHEFCWWVGDLDDTPIHYLFEDVATVVYDLEKYFLTWDADTDKIEMIINEVFI